ncbi:adenosylcobinamide-GDP ribazoletransferase, partial [Amycolatopsis japonica]|uniref:adenosylcobinamide-GDP ribazoletransferase n=1 Tax=Amycolatopsis japonica TaxID=208439 RepID=UPI00331F681E
VAGSVPVWAAAVVFAVLAGAAALVLPWWQGIAAVALGYLAASALLARCVQRLGGITGDVLGACVEVSVAGILLALSF